MMTHFRPNQQFDDGCHITGGFGMEVAAEIARREQRLQALADAKAKIAERVKERDQQAQQDYADKVARREAQRAAGQRAQSPGKRAKSQGSNQPDRRRIAHFCPVAIVPCHEGFVQGYNDQAAVDVDSLLIVAATLTQDTNDKQQVEPLLDEIAKLENELGKPDTLLADNGYFSRSNVKVCEDRGITPLIALGRDTHHLPLAERLAADAPARTPTILWSRWLMP